MDLIRKSQIHILHKNPKVKTRIDPSSFEENDFYQNGSGRQVEKPPAVQISPPKNAKKR